MKKLILAVIVTYVVLMGTNYLIHGVWLMPDYNAMRQSYRSVEGIEQNFWAMAVGQFLFAAMFAYVYARGSEKKAWVGQGIRYGLVMTLLTVIPFALSQYDTYVVPGRLVIKWIVVECVQMIVVGLIVAGIYKEQAA